MTRRPTRRWTVAGSLAGIRTAQTRTASARVASHCKPTVRALLDEAMALLARAERKARAARREAAELEARRKQKHQPRRAA